MYGTWYGELNFNRLKKVHFRTLTIRSVQELRRIIQQQQQTISNLESRLATLEGMLTFA